MSQHQGSIDPTPSPSDDPLEEVPAPGFGPSRGQSRSRPQLDELDPSTTAWTSDLEDEPEFFDDPEFDDELASTPRSEKAASTPASIDIAPLRDLAHTIVGLASVIVRMVRARRYPELPPPVWIADEDDQRNIGDPLARMAARRVPAGADVDAVADPLAVVVGTGVYVHKNLQAEVQAYSELAHQPQSTTEEHDI